MYMEIFLPPSRPFSIYYTFGDYYYEFVDMVKQHFFKEEERIVYISMVKWSLSMEKGLNQKILEIKISKRDRFPPIFPAKNTL